MRKPMNDEIGVTTCNPWTVTLYIGGCIVTAKAFLAKLSADAGACWSVEPTEFVYSGGREQGMIVRDINYARYPRDPGPVEDRTTELGIMLMRELGQGSCSVVGPLSSRYLTRRKE